MNKEIRINRRQGEIIEKKKKKKRSPTIEITLKGMKKCEGVVNHSIEINRLDLGKREGHGECTGQLTSLLDFQ